jgi:Zn ribbon nucleic-acid-binding protein
MSPAASETTWEENGVTMRRCSKCGDAHPLETGFYRTGRKDGADRRRYWCKECDRARSEHYRNVTRNDPEKWARRNASKRAWEKRHPARSREAQRRYEERLRADPVRWARHLENKRMQYRLRQERAGRSLDAIKTQPAPTIRESRINRVPAAPLAAAIDRYARRNGLELAEVCESAGIDPRNQYGWGHGERDTVQFDVADRVLQALGLLWFDVWDYDDPAARRAWEGDDEEVLAA